MIEREPCNSKKSAGVSISNSMDTSTDAPIASTPLDISTTTNDQITTTVSSYINEEKEKAKKKPYLIIHNVGESTSEDGLQREKEDIDNVPSIFQQYLDVSPSIIKVLCLGIRHEKPRLLKITVSSESEKYLNPKKHFKAM